MYDILNQMLNDKGIIILEPEKVDILELEHIEYQLQKNYHNVDVLEDIFDCLGFVGIIDWEKYVPKCNLTAEMRDKVQNLFKTINIYRIRESFQCYLEDDLIEKYFGDSSTNFFLKENDLLNFLFDDWEVVSLFLSEEERINVAIKRIHKFVLDIMVEKNISEGINELIKLFLLEAKKEHSVGKVEQGDMVYYDYSNLNL